MFMRMLSLTILCNRLVEDLLKGMRDVNRVFSSNRHTDPELKRNSAAEGGGVGVYPSPSIAPKPYRRKILRRSFETF